MPANTVSGQSDEFIKDLLDLLDDDAAAPVAPAVQMKSPNKAPDLSKSVHEIQARESELRSRVQNLQNLQQTATTIESANVTAKAALLVAERTHWRKEREHLTRRVEELAKWNEELYELSQRLIEEANQKRSEVDQLYQEAKVHGSALKREIEEKRGAIQMLMEQKRELNREIDKIYDDRKQRAKQSSAASDQTVSKAYTSVQESRKRIEKVMNSMRLLFVGVVSGRMTGVTGKAGLLLTEQIETELQNLAKVDAVFTEICKDVLKGSRE